MIPDTQFPTISVTFEAPDILVTRVQTDGLIDAESVLGCTALGAQVCEQRSDIYWLNILGKVKGMAPEARPRLKEIPPMRPYAYVGVVESFVTRAWLQMALRGMVLLGRLSGKIVLLSSEQEARDWISADRARKNYAA